MHIINKYLCRVPRVGGDEARRLGLGEELLGLLCAEVGADGPAKLLVLLLQGGDALLQRLQQELLADP